MIGAVENNGNFQIFVRAPMNLNFNNGPVDRRLIENEKKIRANISEHRLEMEDKTEIERYTDRYNSKEARNNELLEKMLIDEIFPKELGGYDDDERLENTVTEEDGEFGVVDEGEGAEEKSDEDNDEGSDERKDEEPVL
ncbi:hypothetical protein VCUG_01737 [Vavraia culicis subsp. floridensis]|uniref:Uncharacterized protein n=1 Tax=Vavraia culicis (isolate floridensis) TaxID=948595 RepID=L2GU03_VAVCU|nr:uncharacterized protein VCUG_01737 [Vavraia culicis subsp. floridensis]ELA46778.1 hypothetical protein VCUG_01737 [Vavraia culicis subsp. floridensis]